MRKIDARDHREAAARIAHDRRHPVHVANGEERAYRDTHSFMSFTKGLPHDPANGLVKDTLDPVRLRTAIDSGYTRDFDLGVPLGDRDPATGALTWHFFPDDTGHRKWEAPTAGFVYDLQGPDAQAVTMPPAPPIVTRNQPDPHTGKGGHGIQANPELVAEMAEVYWLALLRDKPLTEFDDASAGADPDVDDAIIHLGGLDFYRTAVGNHPRRRLLGHGERHRLSRRNVFRGHTPGERKGPYLSQFMLMGDRHLNKTTPSGRIEETGLLRYGSITIDQRVRTAEPCKDYMTHWNEWLDVQNGADVVGRQDYVRDDDRHHKTFRFIATLRDLATYVHFDALYEPYLNACIWLLNAKAPFDPNFRHLLGGTRHTTGFALFGGPHILALMTEVATRGLKAVRFQKFNNHLRLRPEALAGLIAAQDQNALQGAARDHVGRLHEALDKPIGSVTDPDDPNFDSLLRRIEKHNEAQNLRNGYNGHIDAQAGIAKVRDLPLLPMAFPEGSPMHPSYGAGHATVAGACVTILKAFFDEDACLARIANENHKDHDHVVVVSAAEISADKDRMDTDREHRGYVPVAFVPDADGAEISNQAAAGDDFLRIGDELDKLAANISIARNMAGVHYYSDYIDSLRMGEEIAIGVLQEQSIMYPKDPFQVSLTSFDGKRVIIGDGEVQCLDPETGHDHGQFGSHPFVSGYDDHKNAAD